MTYKQINYKDNSCNGEEQNTKAVALLTQNLLTQGDLVYNIYAEYATEMKGTWSIGNIRCFQNWIQI